jgi:hypothetical protein
MGMASNIGNIGSSESLVFAKQMGSAKVRTRLLLHELGHVMGAMHLEGGGLMHPAIQGVQLADSFAEESIEQMKQIIQSLP